MTDHKIDQAVLNFFGFSRLPFSKHIAPNDFFPTQSFQEALARLQFGIENEDIILLTGPVGSGKSIILTSLIHSLDSNAYTAIYVRGDKLKEGELYKTILCGLNREAPRFIQPAKQLFYALVPQLTKKPLVIIDDSQDVQDFTLMSIKSMVNFGFDSDNKITFILCAQPELKAKLKLDQFLALKQRIRVYYHMNGMSLEETCGYIDHHTKIAGRPAAIFSDGAKSDIHRTAEGIPRRVNVICYQSIINAAIKEVSVIDSSELILEEPTD